MKGKPRNKITISNCQMEGVIKIIVPHLHEGQSQEIVKKSKTEHEVLHEVFEKVLVSLVY